MGRSRVRGIGRVTGRGRGRGWCRSWEVLGFR